MSTVKDVRLQDLLPHGIAAPVYGSEAFALIHGKSVMVTGAGGSIGSELVRQAFALGADEVLKVDNDEFALYTLELDLTGQALLDDPTYILADICDDVLMNRLMQECSPDIVFHAAAKKHLPLLERSPESAVKTNVFGTHSVIKAAINNNVKHVVNISTDKAAAPTSALGWSKRLAEYVAASLSTKATKVVSVRFGNVLASRGSFLPTLIHQLNAGIPVQITDTQVSRFFMTIPEAAGLVVEAACLAKGGDVYVLDMGTPVRIIDLVDRYVQLSGCPAPKISITGLRKGEKIQEVRFEQTENILPTAHPRIAFASPSPFDPTDTLIELRRLIVNGAPPKLVREALEFEIY